MEKNEDTFKRKAECWEGAIFEIRGVDYIEKPGWVDYPAVNGAWTNNENHE